MREQGFIRPIPIMHPQIEQKKSLKTAISTSVFVEIFQFLP